MNQQNLIPMAYQREAQQARAVRRWAGIVGSYFVTVVVVSVVCFFINRSTVPASQAMEPIAAEINRANTSLVSMRGESAVERHRLQSLLEVSDQPDWSILMRVVSRLLGDSIVLDSFDLGPPAKVDAGITAGPVKLTSAPGRSSIVVHLNGIGRSQGAITDLVLRLEGMHLFEKVSIVQTAPRMIRGTEGTSFRLDCVIDNGEGQTK